MNQPKRSNPEVAQTILAQIKSVDEWALGAWGARNFVYDDDSVSFKIRTPKFQRNGYVRITLDRGLDLYTVEAMRWNPRKLEMQTVDKRTEIYWDVLVEVIDRMIENRR